MGTLGRPLRLELERRGHDVWGVDLQHQAEQKYFRADIASYRQMERALEQDYDYVYHLAAEFGRINGEENYDTLWTTNVIGTRNILEIQKQKKFKLIFASSSEIYGDKHKDILAEDIPLNHSIIQHNDYAVTKWVNEIQIMNFEKRFGSQVVRLRFFNAYGPGEFYHNYRSVVCLFIYRALHRLPYDVYLGYHRVFMYIDDFIPTLANVCGNYHAGEVYNIGGVEFRSVKELSDLILKHVGIDDSIVKYLPEDKHNVVNKRPNIEKARAAFGHDPRVLLEEGIPATVNWMRTIYADSIAKLKL